MTATRGWKQEWSFLARLEKLGDGDTVTLLRDYGKGGRDLMTIRVQNVDTTETRKGEELSRQWAQMAKEFTADWFAGAQAMHEWPVRIWTDKVNSNTGDPKMSLTRWVAYVHRVDGADLGQWLTAKGLAISVRDWMPSKWPNGIFPGAWVREAGTRNKVHLIRQATPLIESACGLEFESPGRVNTPVLGERCGSCWGWSAYSSPLWAEIVATNTRLQYGSGSLLAKNHPGARLLLS